MKLPLKFKLIQVINFSYVFRMELIPVINILEFKLSIHSFNTPLTKSIIDSFQANDQDENYFKMLPLQQQWSSKLKQNDAEQGLVILQNVYNSCQNKPKILNNQELVVVDLPWVKLHLYYYQLYGIGNFWYECVHNWTYWTVEYFKNADLKTEQKHTQITSPIIEFKTQEVKEDKEDIEDIDIEISNVNDDISIINDCLKLSLNNIMIYYISRYVQNYINTEHHEKEFNIIQKNDQVYLTMSPLLDTQLIGISKSHYMNILNILLTFKNITQDEVYYKLKLLVKEFRFLVNLYLQDPEKNKDIVILPLKIIELQIFIYGIYHYQLSFAFQIPETTPDPIKFHNIMISIVNYYIKNIMGSMDNSYLGFSNINITHPSSVNFEEPIVNLEELKELIEKDKFLLDIDKQGFVDNVYKKLKTKTKKETAFNLILSNGNVLDITKFIDVDNTTKLSWLNYKTFKTPKNINNTVITQEYYHLLQIATSETNIAFIEKDLNPIISHYAEIILNHIFNKINNDLDKKKAISTLNLVNNYIKPFVKDAPINTEMIILYKCVIPYLYDMFNISEFIDYFH